MQQGSAGPLVVFDGVRKSFDGRSDVVAGLDLEIACGEFLTLLGPSGSGKTTILMMLAGFERPSAGRILFDGQPIDGTPTWKRNFGLVFQNYALFPHMSVAQNLAFPLRMHRFPAAGIAARVDAALDMVRLSHLADRRPAQLSGGQQQRVALARALVFQPRMVLLDEPLGALDKQLREHMQLEIRALHERLGITMLYVTHDQTEALTMSDRIAIFDAGRLQQTGSPAAVYDSPANPFVATFIGENNVIRGTVAGQAGEIATIRTAQGGLVAARAPAPLAAGAPAQVMIRPERVFLAEPGRGANCFAGRVADVIYHGDHLRLVLDLDGLGAVTARFSYADTGTPVRPGTAICATWAAERALAFPAARGDPA
jgi:putative spermidine/putrescine transport system ATP-binding protein